MTRYLGAWTLVARHHDYRQCPNGFCYPTRRAHRPVSFSGQEKRDIVWLIDQGWWPLDVAVAFGIAIYERRGRSSQGSRIYDYYQQWKDRYGEAAS